MAISREVNLAKEQRQTKKDFSFKNPFKLFYLKLYKHIYYLNKKPTHSYSLPSRTLYPKITIYPSHNISL